MRIAKLLLAALLLSAALAPLSLGAQENEEMENFYMTARLVSLGDRLEVEVIESDSGMVGVFWVITSEETLYTDSVGNKIGREALKAGDLLRIRFGGQIMMSYPPQIVARGIGILDS